MWSVGICAYKDSDEPWYCKTCLAKLLIFSNLTDYQSDSLILGKLLAFPKQVIKENQLTFSTTIPIQLSWINSSIQTNLENLYMNIFPLSYYFDDFRDLITNSKLKPKLIGECQLKKNKHPLRNIQLSNYIHEFTSTESFKCGTIIYIENSISYKVKHELNMCKPKEIESTFTRLIEYKAKNKDFWLYIQTP